jgi:hypothetical protein
MSRRALLLIACLAAAPLAARAQIPNNLVRVGVLSDMSGPFADQVGKGSVVAADMAAEDFAPTIRTSRTSAPASPANGSTSRVWTPSSTCRTPAWRWPSPPSCARRTA